VFESLRTNDPVRIGSYSLTGRLGAGGFGTVYAASGDDGVDVALKVLRPELADDVRLRDRLAREGQAIQRVEGSRTVKVFDVVTEGDYAYLVMELLEGEDLETLVERDGPLTGPQLWFVAEGLTQALRDIHRAGITHRDLKPSNVIYGPDGVKVVDFGVSVVADQTSLTQTGAFVGTAAWISPEQVRDGDATGQSDVFNLGLVIAFVATGKHPFGSGRADAVMYRISNGAPNTEGLREPLASLVAACLQRDPSQRPTIDQLSEFFRTDGASNLAATGPTGTVIVGASQAPVTTKGPTTPVPEVVETGSTEVTANDASESNAITRTRLVRSRRQPNTTAAAAPRGPGLSRTTPAVRTVTLTPAVIIALVSAAAIAVIAGVLLLSGSEQTATDNRVSTTVPMTTPVLSTTTTAARAGVDESSSNTVVTTSSATPPVTFFSQNPPRVTSTGDIEQRAAQSMSADGLGVEVDEDQHSAGPTNTQRTSPVQTAPPPSAAPSDLSGPTISGASVSPPLVWPGGPTLVSVSVSDENHVSQVGVWMELNGVKSDFCDLRALQRVTGTETSGTWQGWCSIPYDAVSGTVFTIRPYARDIVGNWTNINNGRPSITLATVTVL